MRQENSTLGKHWITLSLVKATTTTIFLIHKPLGVTLKLFLDMSRGSLPISYVQELTYQVLHALNFIHRAQVIHAGPTFPLLHSVL